MLHGRDIICISSIDWDFIWQGHQQVMATLAANGNRVLFIENTGVRPPVLHDLPRLRRRIARWWRSTNGFRKELENLYIMAPLVIPLPYSRVARWINRVLLLRTIRRWMRVMRFERPIVWTFLPTPLAHDLLRGLDPLLTIYYCIDDLASSSEGARKVTKSEERVFCEVDLVFVTAERLRERAARFARQVHLFPFAVDYGKFAEVREAMEPTPSDLAALPRPVVGYVGGIHQWVDQGLVGDVARRMPDVTIALVGPVQTDVSSLAIHPNVRLLGAKSHQDVPRYVKGFDIGLIPYRLSSYTEHVYPTKLNEYLAMGLPVVATDLLEVRRFNVDHGDIVTVAGTAERFVAAVRAALDKSRPDEVARRIETARQNGWDARIERMSRLVEERLAAQHRVEGPWEERLRQFYRGTRRRFVRAVVAVGLVYGVLFWSPLPWILAKPLRVVAPPTRGDAIVVLGGGVGESGRPEGYQERVQRAVELYQAGRATHLLFSTGWVYTFHEADVMKAIAVSLGVPEDAIILEKRAASTYENAVFVRQILEGHGWKKVLLVSSPYHMRRALLTFRKVAPDVEVVPSQDSSRFYSHSVGANLPQLYAIAHEYLGIAYYWWNGWI